MMGTPISHKRMPAMEFVSLRPADPQGTIAPQFRSRLHKF